MTSKDDLALLQQSMPTGMEGFKALEKFTRDGNAEVRKLMYDECDMLMECRYCRNLFRSAINFISHKRAFCRVSHVAVALANQVTEEEGKTEYATKKRIGQIGALTKRLEQNLVPIGDTQEMIALYTLPRIMKEAPTTTFADGMQKVIGSLPANLALKEALPADRTCLVMPQDNSSRYKEMSLRSRKAQNTDKIQNREFTGAEIKIIENFEKHDVRCGDFVLLQCDHPSCSHVRPFHSLQALAFHCSLRHTKPFSNEAGDDRWPCLLCCRHMWSLEGVHTHMTRVHPNVKEGHLKKRTDDDKIARGGKKNTYNGSRRSRSLSLSNEMKEALRDGEEASDDEDDQEEMIIEEEDGKGNRRRSSRRGGTTAVPLLLQPSTMDRQSRVSDNSDDYGDPPVLHPVDECRLEEEADEEDDDVPLRHKKQKKSSTPMSENDGGYKEVKEEEEEETKIKPNHNTVEGCMEDLLDLVCNGIVREKSIFKRENTEESSRSTPTPHSQEPSVRKRGRPRKSDLEDRERSKEADKKQAMKRSKSRVGRPRKTESAEPEPKVKRQYIKKKDREMMEAEQGEGERASSEQSDSQQQPSSSDAAAAAEPETETSRPARHRKRPRWMMTGGEEVYGEGAKVSQNLDQSIAEESEEEETTKDEMKKKKTEKTTQLITPHKKRDSTPKKTPGVIRADDKMDSLLYTPKAGKVVMERRTIEANGTSSSSKRKQNLGKLADESEDIMIVRMNDEMNGPKRSDLTSVPVYLSEHQQNIFFSGLIHQKNSENEGKSFYECMYCHVKVPNIRDGRRHMVAHLRVMRLRCGLCGAGSFFCIDMRNHLQMRGCPDLHKAPKHIVRPGTPCMTKEHADELTFVAHSGSPGRALFTSGKIVSILSNSPYLPDPVIEEKILGPTRVPPRGVSPRKPAHKYVMASVLKEAEKGTVSLATVQRSTDAAPAAAAAAAPSSSSDAMPILPIEDSAVHYYEDMQDPSLDAAAAETEQPQQQQPPQEVRRASMPPPDPKALRTIGEPKNAGAGETSQSQSQSQSQSARRVLNFTPAPGERQRQTTPTYSRQTESSSDSEMLSPIAARHRSIYGTGHRMRSPDSTTSSQ